MASIASCEYCGRPINRPYFGYCDEHCEQRFNNFKTSPQRNELHSLHLQLQRQQQEIEELKKKLASQKPAQHVIEKYDSRGRLCCDYCNRPYHANGYERCNCDKGW